jgi:hypothetical protein
MSDWDPAQVDIWHRLYQAASGLLAKHGVENSIGDGDYWLNEDNYGWHRISVGVQNLTLFRPDIIAGLRAFLADYPGWEITVAVDVIGKEKSWPRMGVTVRKHEIVDGLQRQLLPEEFRGYYYPDSRPGTGYD